jgi:hypothetical protein
MMGWVKDGRQWTAVADWRLDWRLLNLEKDHIYLDSERSMFSIRLGIRDITDRQRSTHT